MGKLRRRQRTYKNRSRSAKHDKKIINMKGCSNRKCGQTGGCNCGLSGGGQRGGAWSQWNPTNGGEFFSKNSYDVQPDRMMEATQTTLGSAPFSAAVGGGRGRSKRKGRKSRKSRTSKRRTIRNKKRKRCLSLQKGGSGTTGSIIQEFINAKSDISDMIGNTYTSYKGLVPMPSSAVYRDQFLKVV